VRWLRPRPQRLVLQSVQLRVAPVLEPDEPPPSSDDPPSAPGPVDTPQAPPLAVRPVEDPEWFMVN